MIYKNRITILLIVLLQSLISIGQIQVVNKDLKGIAGVQLFNGSNFLGISDDNGNINVDTSSIKQDTFTLSHNGYHTKMITEKTPLRNAIILHRKTTIIPTIVVYPRQGKRLKNEIATKIDIISKTSIQLYQPQTAADLLNLENKVYIQKSQLGGGSPMIRGFATNRILLVVDNVRMNTAIFREGNVQNVISIDPFSIESTDVIFGPASQLYGSDAIGGVLSFNTTKPTLSAYDSIVFNGNINLRYSSASNEKTLHTDFSVGGKKIGTFTSLTFSGFEDLTMGSNGPNEYTRPDYIVYTAKGDSIIQNNNKNKQVFSGYSQVNVLQKIRYDINKNLQVNYGFHYSTTSDIPRYDRLILRGQNDTLKNGDWYYGPQKWIMNNLSINFSKKLKLSDNAKITIANQKFEESRNDRNYGSILVRQRAESVNAWSLNFDIEKKLFSKTKLSYGIEYIHNRIGSQGTILDITNGTTSPTSSRYPDNSKWESGGAYVNLLHKWTKWYKLETGIRYNKVETSGVFDTSIFSYPVASFTNKNKAITGSISHLFKLSKGTIGIVTSTAFRSPNIDDISKVFDRNEGLVTIPNSNLAPEYAYNGEVNIDYSLFERLRLGASLFYTYLDKAIGVANSTLNGKDSILYDGNLSQVQTLVNQDFASVSGAQLSLKYLVNNHLIIKSSYTLLQSTSSNNEPIRHITPNFGGTSIEYKKKSWKASVYSLYNQEFKNSQFTMGEQNDAFLYPKDKDGLPYSPAWFTLNLRASYSINKTIGINLAIENILDKRYRPYGSGITASGRNLILAFRAHF